MAHIYSKRFREPLRSMQGSDVLPLDRRVAELRTWREVASAACTTKLEVAA